MIKDAKKEICNIVDLIKKRNFKSYTGTAIKNGTYQTATSISSKIGSIIFTIIIARLLLPELFGLYSLALSTIILFASFTDLGISQTLVRYVSRALAKNKKSKAKSYVLHLTRLKFFLTFTAALVLIISAKFISDYYYQKPLFLALLAGSIYIIATSFIGFVEAIFQSSNNFRFPMFKEIFFQVIRLIIVPLAIIFSLSSNVSVKANLFFIVLALAICYLLALVYLLFLAKKKLGFLSADKESISKKKVKEMNKFCLSISAMVLSGVFFGYIDIIMLGRFVSGEFIGYYQAAFGLIGSAAPLIAFSAVLFPLFSRISGKRLERALKKSVRVVFLLSLVALIFTFIFSPAIIRIIYGQDYLQAVPLLRLFSLLFISLTLISTYSSYLISKAKQGIVIRLLIVSTIINVALNYLLIVWLLNYSPFMAVVGATIATLISRYFYMFALMFFRKKVST
jgi:stage V sporulation protein B